MKKVVLILAVILSSITIYAQEVDLGKEFESYSMAQMKVFSSSNSNKNYEQSIILLNNWAEKYNSLNKEQKELYKSTISNINYNLACTYSLNKQKDKAIDAFAKALATGYNDCAHIEADTDFDNIRKDKRFIKLLASIPKKDSYIETLQKAGKYVAANTAGLSRFDYDRITDSRLQSVKKYLKLDSIAGQGDEISKIMNLMAWVHNTMQHDGGHRPDCSEFDALDLYNYTKATGRGINCRMLAIVLNECYLSMGFKSRYVTCLPMDEKDSDCHVINCVYSQTLNKWIWVDPTFNAYLKDENGTLLSIEEVRTRIIENKPIVLNDDANWNNKTKQTKKAYIDNYMAKNLYWLQCPLNSYFNIESPYRNRNAVYISLTPEGFNTSGRFTGNVTHDPSYFWQTPVFQ